MRDLVSLPKVDLHVHLEGSFRPATLREIAAQNRHFLPPALRGDRFVFRDSQEFFELNGVVRDCLVREADFRRVAYELCEDAAAQGVRYMEPSFTLGAHAVRLGEWEMPLRAVLAGLADGEAAFGVGSQLILDHVRKRPAKLAWQTLDVARRYVDRGVVGLGLAGREEYSAAPFAEVFSAARTAGLHSVPHAGEMRGADSVREALELLGAERIGHGFRAMEDPELVAELRLRSIPLEVCRLERGARTRAVPGGSPLFELADGRADRHAQLRRPDAVRHASPGRVRDGAARLRAGRRGDRRRGQGWCGSVVRRPDDQTTAAARRRRMARVVAAGWPSAWGYLSAVAVSARRGGFPQHGANEERQVRGTLGQAAGEVRIPLLAVG